MIRVTVAETLSPAAFEMAWILHEPLEEGEGSTKVGGRGGVGGGGGFWRSLRVLVRFLYFILEGRERREEMSGAEGRDERSGGKR